LVKLAVAPIIGLAGILLLFAPKPQSIKQESSFLYANPIISKAILGNLTPFVADFAWLESTKIGELGKGGTANVNKDEIQTAFLTIATLDPSFYHAISYGASFLSTVPKEKEAAYLIIDRGLSLRPNDFQLQYLKLITEVTSEKPDKKMIKELAVSVFANPEFKGVFGAMKVDDFLLEILAFAGDEDAKKEELKKELEWLYKNTSDKNKKALIAAKLKELN